MTSVAASALRPGIALLLLVDCAGLPSAFSRAPARPEPDEPGWTAAAPMLNGRAAHAVVTDGRMIYVLAGTGALGAPVLDIERFDGRSWTRAGTLPGTGLNAPAAAFLNGRIYLIGGFRTDTNIPTDRVLVYDPDQSSWSSAAPLPAPRGGHAAVVLDGRIHVFGGGNSESTLPDHSVYDPVSDSWSELRPLPRAKGSPSGVALAGRIWVIGGRSGPDDFGDVDIYDPATDQWSTGPAIEPRGTHGAVLFDNAIFVIGGESQARQRTLAEVLRLDSGSVVWRSAPPLPGARAFARAVVMDHAVYAVGGSLSSAPGHASVGSAVVERYGRDSPSH